jgi:hypothetical protein
MARHEGISTQAFRRMLAHVRMPPNKALQLTGPRSMPFGVAGASDKLVPVPSSRAGS